VFGWDYYIGSVTGIQKLVTIPAAMQIPEGLKSCS
jgi:hypothetical protein